MVGSPFVADHESEKSLLMDLDVFGVLDKISKIFVAIEESAQRENSRSQCTGKCDWSEGRPASVDTNALVNNAPSRSFFVEENLKSDDERFGSIRRKP